MGWAVRNFEHKSFVLLIILFLTAAIFPGGILAQNQVVTSSTSKRKLMPLRIQLRGTVARVLRTDCGAASQDRVDTRSSLCSAIDLIVLTQSGVRRICVGPTLFLRREQFLFVPGDRLVVLGFQSPGSSSILAEEIVRNKRAITLRSEDGQPIWLRTAGAPQTTSIKSKVLTVIKENQNER